MANCIPASHSVIVKGGLFAYLDTSQGASGSGHTTLILAQLEFSGGPETATSLGGMTVTDVAGS
jgi:hypothetical protein